MRKTFPFGFAKLSVQAIVVYISIIAAGTILFMGAGLKMPASAEFT